MQLYSRMRRRTIRGGGDSLVLKGDAMPFISDLTAIVVNPVDPNAPELSCCSIATIAQ